MATTCMTKGLLGPNRITDLRTGLPSVSPNALARWLRELERAGVVRHRKLPPPAAGRVYALTGWGEARFRTMVAEGRFERATSRHFASTPFSPYRGHYDGGLCAPGRGA